MVASTSCERDIFTVPCPGGILLPLRSRCRCLVMTSSFVPQLTTHLGAGIVWRAPIRWGNRHGHTLVATICAPAHANMTAAGVLNAVWLDAGTCQFVLHSLQALVATDHGRHDGKMLPDWRGWSLR